MWCKKKKPHKVLVYNFHLVNDFHRLNRYILCFCTLLCSVMWWFHNIRLQKILNTKYSDYSDFLQNSNLIAIWHLVTPHSLINSPENYYIQVLLKECTVFLSMLTCVEVLYDSKLLQTNSFFLTCNKK